MTSIDESARPAEVTDLDVVEALVECGRTELEPRRGGSIWARREARADPIRPGLEQALADARQLLVVGAIDEMVVGYASMRLEVLHDGADLAGLDEVYVLPEARGVGVGESMLTLCMDWAQRQGSVGVDSLALPGDRHTKNFFESFGLVARAIIVHRDLGESRP